MYISILRLRNIIIIKMKLYALSFYSNSSHLLFIYIYSLLTTPTCTTQSTRRTIPIPSTRVSFGAAARNFEDTKRARDKWKSNVEMFVYSAVAVNRRGCVEKRIQHTKPSDYAEIYRRSVFSNFLPVPTDTTVGWCQKYKVKIALFYSKLKIIVNRIDQYTYCSYKSMTEFLINVHIKNCWPMTTSLMRTFLVNRLQTRGPIAENENYHVFNVTNAQGIRVAYTFWSQHRLFIIVFFFWLCI